MATLENQTILIVGGSSGIGFAVAKASLLSLAAKVIIASSSAARVQNAIQRLEAVIAEKKLPGKVVGDTVNATNVDVVEEFVAKVGVVDHLIWTSGDSGLLSIISSPDVDLNKAKNIFDVRYWGAAAAAKAAKIRPGGSVVITTGAALYKPMKSWSLVAGIVGAADALTRGLAIDMAPIRVNSVCPGVVDTEIFDSVPADARQMMFEKSAESLLVKHVGTADECAEAYLFLMKCTYITGQRIEVDGGYRLS